MLNEDVAAAPLTEWALNIPVSIPALEIIFFNHLPKVAEEIGLLGFICDNKSLFGTEGSIGRKPIVRFSYSIKHSTTYSLGLLGKLA